MFAKRAQQNFNSNLGLGRNPAAVRPCNDNQPTRGAAPARPMRRPALFCRWHKTSAGRLECRWRAEALTPSGSEEPGISWRDESQWPSKVLTIRPRHNNRRGRKATLCRQSSRSALTALTCPHSIHSVQVHRSV